MTAKQPFSTMSHAELCQAKRMLEVNISAMTEDGRETAERDLATIEDLLVSLEDGTRTVQAVGASVPKGE